MPDTVLGIENSTLTMLLIRSLLLSMYCKDKFKDKGKTDNLIQTIRLIFCMPLEHKPLWFLSAHKLLNYRGNYRGNMQPVDQKMFFSGVTCINLN